MPDTVKDILLAAFQAANHGFPPRPVLAEAVAKGDQDLKIGQLNFDSLAWLEFCISVELQSGLELAPVDIERMQYVFEIEEWLRGRM